MLRAVTDREACYGFELCPTVDLGPGHPERLREALATVDAHTPWVLARARRDLEGIAVSAVGAPRYDSLTGFVWVSTRWLDMDDPEWLASGVVYALVSARLFHRRGGWFRKFRIAFEEQVAFARRLPTGYRIVEHLTRRWDEGFYLPAVQVASHRRYLESQDIPAWLVGALLRLRPLVDWYHERRFGPR